MIFVAVGTQMPFDRLIRAIDSWADSRGENDVFAQCGDTGYTAKRIRMQSFLSPQEFTRCVESADLIVSHAGMGTIITALEKGKPILVMPRRACLGEHRNEHQLGTARNFAPSNSIEVAFDEQELIAKMDRLVCGRESRSPISCDANPSLIKTIQDFIFQ
ncbi:glucuronosyltransferase [Alsobacter soli]|uniref:Glucuronosyltransferase n=1 Tax=Alsobacter soli TaxID=2109933 RepID=A0A2T1HLC1_9HYPH|nr:glycosyltransferase [Alsobacter soli]PSC02428.1 glucuronosyltransferase [Alsobacter soli]